MDQVKKNIVNQTSIWITLLSSKICSIWLDWFAQETINNHILNLFYTTEV